MILEGERTARGRGAHSNAPDVRNDSELLVSPCMGRFCISRRFNDSHDPTIEDAFKKELFVDDVREKVEVLDTAGQEEFSSFRHTWMQDKDA